MEPALTPPPLRPGAKTVRRLGWLLVVIGLGLSAGMAFLALYLHGVIVGDALSGAHDHWTGSPEFTRTTFELFGTIFVFGVVATMIGALQIRTGRRNIPLLIVMLLLVGVMAYLGNTIVQTGSANEPPTPRTY